MSTNRMFTTQFLESVARINPSGIIEDSSMQSSKMNQSMLKEHQQNSSLLVKQQLMQNMEQSKQIKENRKKKKALHDLDFDELISKFIAKDSQSNLQTSSIITTDNQSMSHQHMPTATPSTQQTQKKPQVYEYQQKQPLQPSHQVSDNSKTLNSGGNLSNGKITSSQINKDSKKTYDETDKKQNKNQKK